MHQAIIKNEKFDPKNSLTKNQKRQISSKKSETKIKNNNFDTENFLIKTLCNSKIHQISPHKIS